MTDGLLSDWIELACEHPVAASLIGYALLALLTSYSIAFLYDLDEAGDWTFAPIMGGFFWPLAWVVMLFLAAANLGERHRKEAKERERYRE